MSNPNDYTGRPLASWAREPVKVTREERKEWRDWYNDDKGVDKNKNRFTCSGPTSWGARVDDIDAIYDRMVARGVVAAEPKNSRIPTDYRAPVTGMGPDHVFFPLPKPKKRGRK